MMVKEYNYLNINHLSNWCNRIDNGKLLLERKNTIIKNTITNSSHWSEKYSGLNDSNRQKLIGCLND